MGESSVLSSPPTQTSSLWYTSLERDNLSHHKNPTSPQFTASSVLCSTSKIIIKTMRVSSIFTFLFAAIATETVGAQGIFRGRNNGNRVRALVEEVSMSADLSLSLSFGGIGINADPGSAPEPSGKSGKGSSMMSMGMSGKGGSMMSMCKSSKGVWNSKKGKSTKSKKPTTAKPTESPTVVCNDESGYEVWRNLPPADAKVKFESWVDCVNKNYTLTYSFEPDVVRAFASCCNE